MEPFYRLPERAGLHPVPAETPNAITCHELPVEQQIELANKRIEGQQSLRSDYSIHLTGSKRDKALAQIDKIVDWEKRLIDRLKTPHD